MGGTSNPSEEQLALVTARVIEIASAISETAASLDGSGYFEDSGFDDEERGAALSARLLEYCGSVEELDPNIDDHPQPRRMARYLLENVEFEVLQAPLPSALSAKPKEVAGEGAGLSKGVKFGATLAFVAMLFVLALYSDAAASVSASLSTSASSASGAMTRARPSHLHPAHHRGTPAAGGAAGGGVSSGLGHHGVGYATAMEIALTGTTGKTAKGGSRRNGTKTAKGRSRRNGTKLA